MNKDIAHWSLLLKQAGELEKEEQLEEAYVLLRGIYEANTFRYDKIRHANYEDYIEEKVQFFIRLAQLSMKVTEQPSKSIPYIDEALILLDASESVGPYIDAKHLKQLKKDYTALAKG